MLTFNLTNKSSTRKKRSLVTNANLKMYKFSRTASSQCSQQVFINVYQIMTSRSSITNSSEEMLVLSKKLQNVSADGWHSFNVLQSTRMWWYGDHLTKHSFRISCKNCDACGISFVTKQSSLHEQFAPRLDLYVKRVSTQRLKRSWRRKNLRRFGKRKRNFKTDCTSGHESRKCCRYNLWVSFKDIGWDSWIVSPEGFDAFYCKGKCSGRFKPANTHTLVQTALRKKANMTLPKPCCVPKKLTPLSLYHYDDSDPPELVLTTHKGMIVKSCACS